MNYEQLVNQAVEAAQSAQQYASQATEAKSAVEALVVKINDQQVTELNNIKQDIKQALINKGQNPTDSFQTYSQLIQNIQTGSDIDLSFVTASSSQILAGYTGTDTEGNPVNGSIQHKYSSDVELNPEGSIDIPKGYYQNTEVTLPQSTTTVDANEVTTTIGWSKGQTTTTVGTLIEGGQINPTTADQTIAKNSFLASDIVVKGQQNFTQENIAQGVTMWGKTGTFKGGTSVVVQNVAGVLVDDGTGGLKVQKLNFDGTVASNDGEPVTAQNFYVFNTGKAEPDYGEGGEPTVSAMKIYKCVDADGLTWWVVSGCGSTEANGRYYEGDEIQNDYGNTVKTYYQENGSCSLQYPMDYWVLKSGSTVLYRDELWSYYDGDPSQCTGWVVDSGVEPIPAITKETTNGNGWKGKKYDTETGEISDTVTSLTYTAQMPKIGKYYTANASLEITIKDGLLFYAPCAEYGKEVEFCTNAAYMTYNNISSSDFTELKGVKCLYGAGNKKMYCKASVGKLNSLTASCMFYTADNLSNYSAPVGFCNVSDVNDVSNPLSLGIHYPAGSYYFGDGLEPSNALTLYNSQLNTWTHLSVVIKLDGYFEIYINGVMEKTGIAERRDRIIEYISFLSLAQSGTTSNHNATFNGAVAEVKLWGKALTANEIKAESDRCIAMVTE